MVVPGSLGMSCESQTNGCAPSADGCSRCQTVPAQPASMNDASLLLAPQDRNADETLKRALVAGEIPFSRVGPLLIVGDARRRLGDLKELFNRSLSPYTKSCIRAAYAPAGTGTMEQALASFAFAEPLTKMLENAEHEWVREALAGNWLFSVFHPILDARHGDAFAYECLIRARDPQSGKSYGAGQLIGACEALNLQHQLDQRARQAAIGGGAKHATNSRLFINFLPNTIYDPEVCLRTTMQAAEEHNVAMSRLVFEVVETEKIPDMNHLLGILNYYRDRGVGTAVDDMGAGFTSIEYINSLQPDFVKLDRELVIEAEADFNKRSKMDQVIRATHAVGGKVVAEGIETTAQHRMCVEAGCDLVQGFLFCKPACPPAAISFQAIRKASAA